jgi:hypothetical protein
LPGAFAPRAEFKPLAATPSNSPSGDPMPDELVSRLASDVAALKNLTRQLEAGREALVRDMRRLVERVERLERHQPPPRPPTGDLPPATESAPAIDLATVIWHREDVSAWDETSRIEEVTIEYPRNGNPNDGRVCFPHSMAGKWPVFNDEGNLGEGNVWVFGFVDGAWHAAPAEWLKPGQTCKRFTNETSTDDSSWGIGPHTKEPPMETWGPKSGEWIGLMVSCPARSDIRTKRERSDVYMVRWP